MNRPPAGFLWRATACILMGLSLGPQTVRAQDWISQLPEGEGREVLGALCIRCHDLQRVVGQRRNRLIWQQTVHSMLPAEELEFLAEEVDILVHYLGSYLGPLVPDHETLQNDPELKKQYMRGQILSIIDLNSAVPGELERLPGIDGNMASSITDFRALHGSFTSIQDLLQVEGMDATLLDRLDGLIEIR